MKDAQRDKYCFEPIHRGTGWSWLIMWASLSEKQADAVRRAPGVARFLDHACTVDCWSLWFDPRFDSEVVQDNIIEILGADDQNEKAK